MQEKSKENQRVAGLQHGSQQPRLATEEDVKTDIKKIRKRTEGAAADDAEKHGGISSARQGRGRSDEFDQLLQDSQTFSSPHL